MCGLNGSNRLCGEISRKIPRTDCLLQRRKDRILTDTGRAAEHQGVVDLIARPLAALCEVFEEMPVILGINFLHQPDPKAGFRRIARLDPWPPVEVETRRFRFIEPSAVGNELVYDEHRLGRCPCHLLHRPVLIEPRARLDFFRLAVAIEYRLAVFLEHRHRRQLRINSVCAPMLPGRQVDVSDGGAGQMCNKIL